MNYTVFDALKELNIDPEEVVAETKLFCDLFYTDENIRDRIAYPSDKSTNRESYGFAITSEINEKDSKYFNNIQKLTQMIYDLHDIDKSSTLLFNIQFYYDGSSEVPKHYDGEYFEFFGTSYGSLQIGDSLRSHIVSVLTLVNETTDGGTRIWDNIDGKENSTLIKAKVGEVVTFDNLSHLHSADAFRAESTRADKLVRMTIGWRSIEDKCHFMYKGKVPIPVDMLTVKRITAEWMSTVWSKEHKEFLNNNKKPAF